MAPEANIDSILVLEKKIEEGLGDIIQLKRARNSLLNISTRVPPELLGQVFCWNAIPVGEYGELEKGSYNFLLVCHHWFEVASGTPELWTYWGNTLEQWRRRYQRSRTAPLDLVLRTNHTMNPILFDGPLRDAVRARVACNSIRSILLGGTGRELLQSVVASLTLDGEDIQDSSIESLIVEGGFVNISPFLVRYRFPRLRTLSLYSRGTSSWDHLKIQATSLTTLSLWTIGSPTRITRYQFISTLSSYPNLQDLSLRKVVFPEDIGDGSTSRVPLHQLKKLLLMGLGEEVISLLDWLEHPDKMDSVYLDVSECVGEGVSEFFEQYLRDRIRRDDRFRNRLGIQLSGGTGFISFRVCALGQLDALPMRPGHGYPSVSFAVGFRGGFPQGGTERLCTNLLTVVPRERVVEFTWGPDWDVMKEIDVPVTMESVENLYLLRPMISGTFLRPDRLSLTKRLPSLRHLYLDRPTLRNDDDWRPLIAYLTHQTSGGQAISLVLRRRRPPVPLEVVREIEGLVDEFDLRYFGDDR